MKRRNQNRESSPQSPLPFPDQLLPDNNASHPYKPPPPDSGILHHSSRGMIQDAAEGIGQRWTAAALPVLLAVLRAIHERDGRASGSSEADGRSEARSEPAALGSGGSDSSRPSGTEGIQDTREVGDNAPRHTGDSPREGRLT